MGLKISNLVKDCVLVPVYKEKNSIKYFENKKNEELKKDISKYFNFFNFEGKEGESLFFNIEKQKILVYSIKKEYSLEDLRIAYSNIFKILKSKKEKNVSIEIPKEDELELKAILEGIELSNYKFDKYISEKENNFEIELNLDIDKKYNNLLEETLKICDNVKIVRDLVSENADITTPKFLENIIVNFAKKHKLKVKVLDEKEIQKEKLGLLWAVGKGAKNPPRLIICEYYGNPNSKDLKALIGKGLTFDTGGLNLKPSNYIEDMKLDMAGAATVYGIFKSAIELNLKQNLVLVISSAENAISGNSYKPGDVFVSHKGISVEITNTDAEGRLVLADAMSYIQKNFKISQIFDFATLTGASMIALGTQTAAIFSNDDLIVENLKKASQISGEKIWQLPIFDEHRDFLKSSIADTLNCSKERYGGASSAAAFLEKFIDKNIKWVHFDIAGPAFSKKPYNYVSEQGTGSHIRLMLNYLKNN